MGEISGRAERDKLKGTNRAFSQILADFCRCMPLPRRQGIWEAQLCRKPQKKTDWRQQPPCPPSQVVLYDVLLEGGGGARTHSAVHLSRANCRTWVLTPYPKKNNSDGDGEGSVVRLAPLRSVALGAALKLVQRVLEIEPSEYQFSYASPDIALSKSSWFFFLAFAAVCAFPRVLRERSRQSQN